MSEQHHVVHPITEALRHRRMQRGLSMSEVHRISGVHRASLHTYEDVKCPLIHRLDKWARALGYQIVLIDISKEF